MPWRKNVMFNNPYLNSFGLAQNYQPQPVQVTRVNGENGARAFQIGPNSSALLLDESGTLVWLITSDGAGYKTIAPYDISPHQTAPVPDFSTLEERIKRLEEIINGNSADTATASKGKPSGKSGAD
jgi:hypothetical protein